MLYRGKIAQIQAGWHVLIFLSPHHAHTSPGKPIPKHASPKNYVPFHLRPGTCSIPRDVPVTWHRCWDVEQHLLNEWGVQKWCNKERSGRSVFVLQGQWQAFLDMVGCEWALTRELWFGNPECQGSITEGSFLFPWLPVREKRKGDSHQPEVGDHI